MTRAAADGGDHAHGGVDMWKWLDAAVIVAIGVIVVLAAEWFFGLVVRERLARQADRFLAKTRAVKDQDQGAAAEG